MISYNTECLSELGNVSQAREEQITHYYEGAGLCPQRKAGVGLKSRLPNVMKHEVRDDDVELFCWHELEYVALLEINPVQEAKDPRVLFCLLEAGPFEAGVLESVNPSYLGVRVEFSTNTAQEAKAAPHIENSQSSWKPP